MKSIIKRSIYVVFRFMNIRLRVSAADGAEEIRRGDAAAVEIAVGDTRRSSSRGTFGQRAGDAKDAATCAQRTSRRRRHKAQGTTRRGSWKVTCCHNSSQR